MRSQEERKAHLEKLRTQIKENAERYKRVFSTPDGQAVLEDLRKRSYYDRSTYDPDEKRMGINEGRRGLFVYINNLVNRDAEALLDEITKGK